MSRLPDAKSSAYFLCIRMRCLLACTFSLFTNLDGIGRNLNLMQLPHRAVTVNEVWRGQLMKGFHVLGGIGKLPVQLVFGQVHSQRLLSYVQHKEMVGWSVLQLLIVISFSKLHWTNNVCVLWISVQLRLITAASGAFNTKDKSEVWKPRQAVLAWETRCPSFPGTVSTFPCSIPQLALSPEMSPDLTLLRWHYFHERSRMFAPKPHK